VNALLRAGQSSSALSTFAYATPLPLPGRVRDAYLSFQLTSWPLLPDRLLSRLCSRFYIHVHSASVTAPGGSRTRPRFAHIRRRHVLPRVSRPHTPPWTARLAVEAINCSWSRPRHAESSRRSALSTSLLKTQVRQRVAHVPQAGAQVLPDPSALSPDFVDPPAVVVAA
jgi:hypothetical protein